MLLCPLLYRVDCWPKSYLWITAYQLVVTRVLGITFGGRAVSRGMAYLAPLSCQYMPSVHAYGKNKIQMHRCCCRDCLFPSGVRDNVWGVCSFMGHVLPSPWLDRQSVYAQLWWPHPDGCCYFGGDTDDGTLACVRGELLMLCTCSSCVWFVHQRLTDIGVVHVFWGRVCCAWWWRMLNCICVESRIV